MKKLEDIPKKELRLTFGVFIDGTLNNKDNTDLRNKYARGGGETPSRPPRRGGEESK